MPSAGGATIDRKFDVILPDARGHGGSDAPASDYLYEDHSADVVGLIEALDIRRPVLLGHSMGGMTAAVTASTLGSAVAALVLVDPTFISPAWQEEVFESGVADGHRHYLALSKEKLRAQACARHPHRSDEVIDSLVDAKLRTSLHAFEVLKPPNPDYRTLVQAMVVPTLLIIGDRGVVSLDTARELQELNSMLTVEVVSGAVHGLPYDQPKTVGAMIAAFLSATAYP